MPVFAQLGLGIVLYVLAARLCLEITAAKARAWAFAIVNVSAYFAIVLLFSATPANRAGVALIAAIYFLIVLFSYACMKRFGDHAGAIAWLAFAFPILVLILVKYLPFTWKPALALTGIPNEVVGLGMVGLSYMAFRLSLLVVEVRNETVPEPGLGEYLGFAFFLPTMVLGPINPYSEHHASFHAPDRRAAPAGRCILRIVVGGAKCEFLGNLINQIAYAGIFKDGRPHGVMDLFIAMAAYYLFLYWNFSGFCDIAIGVAGLIGIRVKENFDNPFAARSVKEYWNRWHISLSEYIRDVVFSPLAKTLVRRWGAKNANAAIAVAIFVAFTIVGVWHGVGWQYLLFGVIHASALVVNHYYTVFMKRRLGAAGYRRYDRNRWVNAASIAATSVFVAAALFVFANDNYMVGLVLNEVFGIRIHH